MAVLLMLRPANRAINCVYNAPFFPDGTLSTSANVGCIGTAMFQPHQRGFSAKQQASNPIDQPPERALGIEPTARRARHNGKAWLEWVTQLSKSTPREAVASLGSLLNDLTGYTMVHQLKQHVVNMETRLGVLRARLTEAKREYEQQISERSRLQRELSSLLQRKGSWGPADLERFTELYRDEHLLEAAEASAKEKYDTATDDVELVQGDLMAAIRERYNEEALWSDKVRAAATWWTWGLMALHFTSFVVVYGIVEPMRRSSLRDQLRAVVDHHAAATQALLEQQASRDAEASKSQQQLMHNLREYMAGGAATSPAAAVPSGRAAAAAAAAAAARDDRAAQELRDALETASRQLRRVEDLTASVQALASSVAVAAQQAQHAQHTARGGADEQQLLLDLPAAAGAGDPGHTTGGTGVGQTDRSWRQLLAAAGAGAAAGVMLTLVLLLQPKR